MSRHVVIAGGGVGGLEAALALKDLAGDRVHIDLLAPARHFTYRPLTVTEPFGKSQTVRMEVSRIGADRGFHVIRDVLDSVQAEDRAVVTQDGDRITYDDLVLAVGARPRMSIPGALAFRGPRDVPRVTGSLRSLEARRKPARVVFLIPESDMWTLPAYELALLTRAWGIDRGLDLEVGIVTPESAPVAAFGENASQQVASLLEERDIALHTGTVPQGFSNGSVWAQGNRRLHAELAVALPVQVGPGLGGIPCDAAGFARVDETCRVVGLEGVYAVGDMTSGDLKQGGLAAQQADVAAASIAAAAGAPVRPVRFRPVLRGLLFTGGIPLYLRHPPVPDLPDAGAGYAAAWWPAHKIVGRHLAPYLASRADLLEPAAA